MNRTFRPDLVLADGFGRMVRLHAFSFVCVTKRKPHEIYLHKLNFGKFEPKSCAIGRFLSCLSANHSVHWISRPFKLSSPKFSLSVPVASSPENRFPSVSLVQRQLRIPSKSFFVYLICASQQLMPHFIVLALLLNPAMNSANLFEKASPPDN